MADKPTIELAKDGPLLVKGLEELQNSRGEALPAKPVMALCRCGGSKTKPFCDGAHSSNGFSDEKLDGRGKDEIDDYVGEGITIHDNRSICSHAGMCTDGLPHVWRMKTEPWIDPDGDEAAASINTINQCPSGALSYTVDGVRHQDQERSPAIKVSKDAPYEVVGEIELVDPSSALGTGVEWGEGASREHYTLCRCGASKNKPFCDGTHWSIEFKDDQTDTLA